MDTNHNRIPSAASRLGQATLRAAWLVLVALGSLVAGHSVALRAQLPPVNPTLPRIVEISPSQALAGQTITVRTFAQRIGPQLPVSLFPPFQATPTGPALLPTRIYFSDASGQPAIPVTAVTPLGNNLYRVAVPQNARSGPLRFGNSLNSTVSLTVVTAGYTITNLSQFDVVSITIDGTQRLAPQRLPATLPSNPNVFSANIGATPGNHLIQVVLGPSASQAVISYSFTASALNPTNVIEVGIMAAGEYLVASPNAVRSGNSVTASWQTFVVNPDPSLSSINGFDFTFNIATGVTTWINWNGSKSNVVASGQALEPKSWPLNPISLSLPLRTNNGTLWTTAGVNLLDRSFLATDGRTYVLQ